MARKNTLNLTTPRGVLIYPHIVEPDTKFQEAGEYHTKIAFDADAPGLEDFMIQLGNLLADYIDENPDGHKEASIRRATRAGLGEEEVDDEGEPTGRIVFKAKLKAKVETKTKSWTQSVRLFDSKAQPITGGVEPWTGTEAKLSVEALPYFMPATKMAGISLRLKAVQILKLVEGGAAGGGGYGFAEEEGGFEADTGGFANEEEADDRDEF